MYDQLSLSTLYNNLYKNNHEKNELKSTFMKIPQKYIKRNSLTRGKTNT